MLEVIVIAGAIIFLRQQLRQLQSVAPTASALAPRTGDKQLSQMLTYADRLYAEKKWLAAEKAYLGVLKVDHKNVTAYSHLGIIYSMQKNLPDALECFTITSRLRPSATSFQNLALAYFDNRNYMKSVAAFEKSIMFEPSAQRYIGLSKAQNKLHNDTASLIALEKAASLDPTSRILEILARAYKDAGRTKEAGEINKRLHELEQVR
jgi:tetratricopeptide (TPR) repeat protein